MDGVAYLWPAARRLHDTGAKRVRFLAPFDPIVWDRLRFEHLSGWSYRFEAYTPPVKRLRGYYAMPLLWGNRVVGWANASVVDSRLEVKLGFANRRPSGSDFSREVDAEIARLTKFLGLTQEKGGLP